MSGDIRLTEYTRGPRGGRAMPAQLPGNSGYTYCVEASIDGIPSTDRVAFSQPVSLYYENFLNTPVGAGVPSATYDRKTNTWDSGSDGYVLKLLSLSPVAIDATGDDVADPVLLTEIGLDSAEAAKIAERFAPGQSFVRARLDHFSTVDTNYILVLEPTPLDVPSNPPAPPPINPDPTECNGSRIECQNQFLGERIPLQGVPTDLYYASDRTSGFVGAYRLDIPVGPIVNPEATVDIVVTVAGKRLFPLPRTQQSLLQTRTTVSALWDGRDLFGRKVQGSRRAKIDINYFPPFRYIPAERLLLRASGGAGGGAAVGGDSWATWDGYAETLPRTPARLVEGGEPKLNQGYEVDVGTWDIGADKLGHWQLGFHHHYDPQSHILYLGTGKRVQTSAIGPVVDNLWVMPSGNPADAPPPELTAIMPDGSVYFAAQNDSKIAKMSRDGSVSVVAGTSTPSFADGTGSAAGFDRIRGLATDDAGNLYIADAGNKRIRKMTPAFVVSTIAGGGADTLNHKPIEDEDAGGGFIGEPNGLGRRPFDGSLVFYETSSRRLWEIRGGKLHGMSLDEDVANNAEGKVDTVAFAIVRDIWAAPNGDIYLCELGATPLMRKLSPSGDVTTIAGGGLTPVPAEGIPGKQLLLTLDFCDAPRLASDGSIYFRAADDIIGRVLVDGTFRTAFGAGSHSGTVEPVQGGAAAQQKVLVNGSNVAPDGSIYVFTPVSVSRVTTLDRWSAGAANLVPSEDGREVYVFDDHGRHIDTKDALTNALIYHFEYDASGLLVRVRDRQNLQTSIQRDSNGVATSITGPYGDMTFLSIDAALDLLTVTSPASEVYTLNYANHLLKELRSPRNAVHRYDYNADGRLIRDKNAGAGGWTLSRAENGPEGAYELTMSTDGGRTTRYSVSSNAVDATRTHDFVHADGTASQTTYKNGEVVTRDPDGLVTTIVDEPDPRFGMRAPTYSVTRKTPVGLERRESTARTTTLTSPLDLTSIDTWQEETSVNGVTASTKYTRATRTIDSASFVGRSQTLTLDGAGYPQTLSRPGITDVTTSFDANGRLQTITQDTRQTTLGYDAKGRLRTVTDPLLRTLTYGRDAAGRVISILRPDLRVIGIGRDAHGNVTSVTPPGRPVHQMSFSLNDVQESYTPPLASGTGTLVTGYRYNADDQLIAIDRPDGLTVDIGRDLAGRARTVSDAFGTRTFNYFAGTGKLGSIAYPAGASLAFSYDGPLLLANEWTGDVAGNVTRIYDDRFFTDRLEVNGVGVDYTIDDDGFVTSVDDLSIVRDPSNALLATISLDQVTTTFAHSPFGERERERTEVATSLVYEESYIRDALGRIETRTIDDGTTPVIFAYHYDMAGRLDEVKKDGVVVETYGYDDNGNRAGGTYDNQDRLLAMGTTSYAYTAAGELRTKTTPGGTTTYSYDQLGNLRRVDLPGTRIDYVIDGLNRRVGKKVDGVLVQGFLYDGQLRIVAELDGANTVVSRFVYASRSNVPDFMMKGGVTYRIITDHVGSPVRVINAADGSIAQRVEYGSFGVVVSDSSPGFQPFGFAGGLRDRDTGLVRFGARDYDPATGRWTAQDPISFGGGDTNLYGYVINDPVNVIDPRGTYIRHLDPELGFAVDNLAYSDRGRELIRQAQESPIPLDIVSHSQDYGYGEFFPGDTPAILIDPYKIWDVSGSDITSYYVILSAALGHELFHFGQYLTGLPPLEAPAYDAFMDIMSDLGRPQECR
ncbi:MAG: hypothetical protein IT381_10190 [Deltaproteobacteria bacterium]|nr:hypothetical protein [Deltaproteobacteria bacterium]